MRLALISCDGSASKDGFRYRVLATAAVLDRYLLETPWTWRVHKVDEKYTSGRRLRSDQNFRASGVLLVRPHAKERRLRVATATVVQPPHEIA
jgi:hypothetical protein